MCYPEPSNRHSKDQNAIIVKKRNVEFDEHEDIVIGHVPDSETLSCVIRPLLKDGTITSMSGEVTGEARKAPEGTWVMGSWRRH